jgi:mannose-6-phosphate isomerase-like protein (cupin superfamily)
MMTFLGRKAMMEAINLAEKFAGFSDYWSPKIVGELNGQHVRLVKLQGEFVWHHHDNEDELFLVVKGQLLMKFRDREVWVNEGEFIIVPRGVEHLPVAEQEVHVVLLEPATTLNTGNIENQRTVKVLEAI